MIISDKGHGRSSFSSKTRTYCGARSWHSCVQQWIPISKMTQLDEKIVCRSTENNEITNVLSALYQFSCRYLLIMKTNKQSAAERIGWTRAASTHVACYRAIYIPLASTPRACSAPGAIWMESLSHRTCHTY